MKKVWVILILVAGVLFSGCQSSNGLQSLDEPKPAAPRTSGRGYAWDSNLRPTAAVVSPARTRPVLQPQIEPQAQPEQVVARLLMPNAFCSPRTNSSKQTLYLV